MTWQPIETAPKAETEILLCLGRERTFISQVWFGSWNRSFSCWMTRHGDGLSGDDEPTHWMPLPDPPK